MSHVGNNEIALPDKIYKSVFENTGTAMIIFGEDKIIRLCNNKFEELYGFSKEEVEGQVPWTAFVYRDDLEKMLDYHDKRAIGVDIPAEYEFRFVDRNGIIKDIYIKVGMIDSSNLRIASFIDITNRKKTERALRESEMKYRNLFESSIVAVGISDLNGKLLEANDSLCKMTGYDKDELKSMNLLELYANPHERFIILRNLSKDGKIENYEIRLKNKNNGGFWINSTFLLIKYEGRRALLVTAFDITKRKLTEYRIKELNEKLESYVLERTEQLNQAMKELENENQIRRLTEEELRISRKRIEDALRKEKEHSELQSSFINMISHEYRTPLTVILSSTYLVERLLEENNKEKILYHLDKVQKSVRTMTSLIEEVLDIRKTEDAEISFATALIDLNNFGSSIIEEIKIIDKEQHKFKFINNNEAGRIESDPKLLRQIIFNLLVNAINYSPSDTVVTLEFSSNENHNIIKVGDVGIGIPDDEKDLVFEPFFKGRSHIGIVSGIGLGLTIVKRFVNLLNGSVYINSKLNVSTTVTIKFPK